MEFALCQQLVSKHTALCHGVMDGAGSWRTLVVHNCEGQLKGWGACILICTSDLGRFVAGT